MNSQQAYSIFELFTLLGSCELAPLFYDTAMLQNIEILVFT